MSVAFKCDVVNCNQMAEGSAPGDFVVASLGVRKHLCSKHTDGIINSYFPDLVPKEEPVEPTQGE